MYNGSHQLTRRSFVRLGGASAAALSLFPSLPSVAAEEDALLKEAIDKLEYLTPIERAFILDKGNTGIAKLPPEKAREIGQAPETWSLEVVPDTASGSIVEKSFSLASGNALNWDGLMKMADAHAVRFMHVTTCTNSENPFHISLWEGVPLREIVWLTQPKDNVRRVYYQSYHQEGRAPFQSSLAMGQILESAQGDMPVILAYKMNGQAIPASHGGPVRVIVPGSYGSKSIKWVRRIVLTNEFKANDTDADPNFNNDPENALKTRARFINPPKEVSSDKPIALTGMAQIGIAGLRSVQYCVQSRQDPKSSLPADDPSWSKADWKDAAILPPPQNWGGGLPEGKLPETNQTNPATGNPVEWPLRYLIVHWAALIPALPAGSYDLCCRTIDGNGIAQPMPRTFPRTGHNTLHVVPLIVK